MKNISIQNLIKRVILKGGWNYPKPDVTPTPPAPSPTPDPEYYTIQDGELTLTDDIYYNILWDKLFNEKILTGTNEITNIKIYDKELPVGDEGYGFTYYNGMFVIRQLTDNSSSTSGYQAGRRYPYEIQFSSTIVSAGDIEVPSQKQLNDFYRYTGIVESDDDRIEWYRKFKQHLLQICEVTPYVLTFGNGEKAMYRCYNDDGVLRGYTTKTGNTKCEVNSITAEGFIIKQS